MDLAKVRGKICFEVNKKFNELSCLEDLSLPNSDEETIGKMAIIEIKLAYFCCLLEEKLIEALVMKRSGRLVNADPSNLSAFFYNLDYQEQKKFLPLFNLIRQANNLMWKKIQIRLRPKRGNHNLLGLRKGLWIVSYEGYPNSLFELDDEEKDDPLILLIDSFSTEHQIK